MRAPNALLACSIAFAGTIAAPAYAGVALQVSIVDGQKSNTVDFGNVPSLTAGSEAGANTVVVRRVRLTISSSSLGRYQILQQPNGPWTNPMGEEFPFESVLFNVTETAPKGDVRVPNPTPMRSGEQDLYLSSASGEDTELLITYTAQAPEGQKAGRYRTSVSYRVVSQ